MPVTYELLTVRNDLIPLMRPIVLDTVDGLGVAPLHHIVQANAQQDGVTYRDTRLDPRVVTFAATAACDCEADLWTLRKRLVDLQAELAQGYRLRVAVPTGERYQCDLRYLGGLSLPHDLHMDGRVTKVAWQGITHDNPTLYDPDEVQINYNLGDVLGEGFPIDFPVSFGSGELDTIDPIVYPGSWRTYPIIRITGPATDIVITNVTTDEQLDMTGQTLDAGETLTIDMTPGVKTMTHSVDGNVIDWLTDDSDLGTFHIAAHPEALGGVNTVTVAFTGGTATTTIQISYYVRYLGI